MKIKSIITALFATLLLSSCGGANRNYESFVSTLEEQPEIIRQIQTPEEYADYIIKLNDIVNDFAMDDVKLTPDRQQRVDDLADKIQEELESKYVQLIREAAPDEDSEAPADSTVNNI